MWVIVPLKENSETSDTIGESLHTALITYTLTAVQNSSPTLSLPFQKGKPKLCQAISQPISLVNLSSEAARSQARQGLFSARISHG